MKPQIDSKNIIPNKIPFGQCPRCGGNTYRETDFYGTYESCVQCGHTKDIEPSQPLDRVHSSLVH